MNIVQDIVTANKRREEITKDIILGRTLIIIGMSINIGMIMSKRKEGIEGRISNIITGRIIIKRGMMEMDSKIYMIIDISNHLTTTKTTCTKVTSNHSHVRITIKDIKPKEIPITIPNEIIHTKTEGKTTTITIMITNNHSNKQRPIETINRKEILTPKLQMGFISTLVTFRLNQRRISVTILLCKVIKDKLTYRILD